MLTCLNEFTLHWDSVSVPYKVGLLIDNLDKLLGLFKGPSILLPGRVFLTYNYSSYT